MRMKDINELAKDPNLISGIHNYCDRWCERCPFTARCIVYATEQADSDSDPASRDINNAAFWDRLAVIFQETKEMITDWAKENGADLSPEALAEAGEEMERDQKAARSHPLILAAEEYFRAVEQWFEKDSSEMKVVSDIVSSPGDNHDAAEEVTDYIEVIRWYQFFIAVKLSRGMLSRFGEDEYDLDERGRDSDGSAKVALIAIDRSLGAWKVMRELKPLHSESIDKMLMRLERLRLQAEAEFPLARDFIRPGFDENLDTLH